MKDFRFSYKFKMACKEDVLKLCPNIKKKYDSLMLCFFFCFIYLFIYILSQ